MANIVKVVGQIVSETGVTLYLDTGRTEELKSDNYRTAKLIEQITPILATHGQAEVDLDNFVATAAVEAKSNGLIRFFRVAKSKVKSIFGLTAEQTLPDTHKNGMISLPLAEVEARQTGVADITPEQVSDLEKAVTEGSADPETTLVAVVDKTPIIGAEALERHIDTAANEERPVGFLKFMELLAEVTRDRKHTSQELLKFMEQADLPIADDGFIVGYKALYVRTDETGRHFVDGHTGKVKQRVGSRVEMPVEKVDDNRRVLCSNGLHIARRKYLTSYGGDVITLVKIDPRDVISVPFNEPDKMRAAAYHIVAELPASAKSFIRSNQPMTQNAEASNILGNVIKGNHVPVTEIVHIGGAKGSDLTITKVGEEQAVTLDETVNARVLDDVQAFKGVSPAEVNAKVDETIKAAMAGDLSAAMTEEPKVEPAPEPYVEPAPVDPAREEVAKRLRVIVVEHLGVDRITVVETASFIDDLGADSLDTVELTMAFEEEFGLSISDEEAENVRTFGDAVTLIAGLMPGAPLKTVTPVEEPKVEEPKPAKKPAKTAPKRETKRPVVNGTKDANRLAAEKEALKLIKQGKSQREASRITGVSARAIGRLISSKK